MKKIVSKNTADNVQDKNVDTSNAWYMTKNWMFCSAVLMVPRLHNSELNKEAK